MELILLTYAVHKSTALIRSNAKSPVDIYTAGDSTPTPGIKGAGSLIRDLWPYRSRRDSLRGLIMMGPW
jgi:hypothetical protein